MARGREEDSIEDRQAEEHRLQAQDELKRSGQNGCRGAPRRAKGKPIDGITGLKRYLSKLSNSDVEGLLRMYALADDYNMAVGKLQNFIDVRELAVLLEIVLIGGKCYSFKV
jgi:hypothetical protein